MPHHEESPTKARQVRRDVDHAMKTRLEADENLRRAYDRLCHAIQVHKETAHSYDNHDDFDRQVRDLTQDVLDAGEHYKTCASFELELGHAACSSVFHAMNAAKDINRDLFTQVEVVQEKLHEYDVSAASDEVYENKLQRLHEMQLQAKDTSDTINRLRRSMAAKERALKEHEPAMEAWREVAAEKDRTERTLKQIQAQLAGVYQEQKSLEKKHALALEKAQRTLQHTQQQCDLARKDLYRQQYAVESVTSAMKSLSSCATKLKLPKAQGAADLSSIHNNAVAGPRPSGDKPGKTKKKKSRVEGR